MSEQDSFYSVKNISHSFYKKEKIELFRDISLDFTRGEIVAIVGKSGVGKSTFLNFSAGLDIPEKGKVLFEKRNITKMKENEIAYIRNQEIGFIFQQFNLIKELSSMENIILPATIYQHNLNKVKEHANELLLKIGLEKRKDHFVSELSGGEMQRVAIARALINKPKIIFADEPTGNLDEKNSLEIFKLLKNFSKSLSCAVVVVTHSNLLAKQCDKVYRLENMKIN